jgi:hypothetical protein
MKLAMKNSQIAMLSAVGVIVLIAVVLVAALRFVLVTGVDDSALGSAVGERGLARGGRTEPAAVLSDLRNFDAIEIRDSWSVELRRGNDWAVELSYPEDRGQSIDVEVRGTRLVLDVRDTPRRGWLWWGHGDELEARITMPELTGIAIRSTSG